MAVIALTMVSSAVALGCAELVTGRLPLSYPMGVRGLAGREQFVDEPHGFCFSINSLGLRTREFNPAKAPDAVRIVLLGDSHAFGVGVDDEDRISERLQRALQGVIRRKVEVLNASQPGTTWTDYVAAARTAVSWRPDLLLVLTYTGNDLGELAVPTFEQPADRPPARAGWPLRQLRRLRIWHLLRRGFRRPRPELFTVGKPPCAATLDSERVGPFAQGVLQACVMSRVARAEDLAERARQLGAELDGLARSHRIPLVIAVLPPKVLVEPAAARRDFDRAAAAFGIQGEQALALLQRAHGSSCRPVGGAMIVDLLGPLRQSHSGALYFARDWHLNGEGHRIVAAVLAEEYSAAGCSPARAPAQPSLPGCQPPG
jgi:lysophospholipase L1-like esterase